MLVVCASGKSVAAAYRAILMDRLSLAIVDYDITSV